MVLLRLVGLIQPALSIWFELRALGHLQLQLACVSSFSEKRFPGSILVLVAVFIIKWGHSEYPVDLAGTCACQIRHIQIIFQSACMLCNRMGR